jgi:hypothetical protein
MDRLVYDVPAVSGEYRTPRPGVSLSRQSLPDPKRATRGPRIGEANGSLSSVHRG